MAKPPEPTQPADAPSMEEILSSIRQILHEDDSGAAQGDPKAADPKGAETRPADPPALPPAHDVLLLNEDMMVPEPASPPPGPAPAPSPLPAPPARDVPAARSPLVAPQAAQAAASSLGNLARTLAQERSTSVARGGPTLEDLVRDEIRPILKDWLDRHLPPLVERVVRAEIERVVGQANL